MTKTIAETIMQESKSWEELAGRACDSQVEPIPERDEDDDIVCTFADGSSINLCAVDCSFTLG